MNKKNFVNIVIGTIISGICVIGLSLTFTNIVNVIEPNPKHNILSSDYISKDIAEELEKSNFVYDPDISIDKEYLKKIKKIIVKTSEIDKDPYKRKISKTPTNNTRYTSTY
jgi:hypothetical protein